MNRECMIAEYATMDKARVGLEVLQLNGFSAEFVSLAWRGNDERSKNWNPKIRASTRRLRGRNMNFRTQPR